MEVQVPVAEPSVVTRGRLAVWRRMIDEHRVFLIVLLPAWGPGVFFWFRLFLGSFLMLSDLAVLVLLYLIALQIGTRQQATRTAGFYAVLFFPAMAWMGWFDSFPLAALLLSVYLILRGRFVLAGAVCGLGFMIKIVPVVALPVALRVARTWTSRIVAAVAAAAVAGVIAVPFLFGAPAFLVASFESMFYRAPWETVWALAEGYIGYGQVAPLSYRFSPGMARYLPYQSHLPLWIVTLVCGVLYLWILRRPVRLEERSKIVSLAGLSVLFFLFQNKGYSPQFLVYVLPFLLLLFPNYYGLGIALALSLVNLLEWPIYFMLVSQLWWVLVFTVVIRTALLVLVAVQFARILAGQSTWPGLGRRLARAGLPAAGAALVVGVAVGYPLWRQAAYETDPMNPVYTQVEQRSAAGDDIALVFTGDDLYHRFYPYFHSKVAMYLFRPEEAGDASLYTEKLSPDQQQARLEEIARTHRSVWTIRYTRDLTAGDVQTWLGAVATRAAQETLSDTLPGRPVQPDRMVEVIQWSPSPAASGSATPTAAGP